MYIWGNSPPKSSRPYISSEALGYIGPKTNVLRRVAGGGGGGSGQGEHAKVGLGICIGEGRTGRYGDRDGDKDENEDGTRTFVPWSCCNIILIIILRVHVGT